MEMISSQRAVVLLSGMVLLCAAGGAAAQVASRAGQNQMAVEPGDPQAYYHEGRRAWFMRPEVLAESEGGGKASGFSISLLDNAALLSINGPQPESWKPWAKPILDALEKFLGSVQMNQPLVVAFTLSPRDEPACTVWSPETLDEQARQGLSGILAAQTQAPRPSFVDCHVAFVYHPPGMKSQDDPGIPATFCPSWRESREYQTANLADKVRLVRKWSREQALPLLAGSASQAEEKFEGIRAFGDEVLQLGAGRPIEVERITFHNPNFWRATIEIAGTDVMISAAQVFLFAANGELGKAGRLLQILPPARHPEQLASVLLARLRGRLADIEAATGRRIQEGIRLFDRKQYAKAAAVFESVLKENPASAWACHELLLARRMMTGSDAAVKDYEAQVYGRDPLYSAAPIHVDTGERAYRAVLRMGMRELFKDQSKSKSDYARYTQIVFDLGEYGYAAVLYWGAFERVTPGDYEALRHCLYCLEQLEVPQIKAFFKPEYATRFDQIDQERRQRREGNPAYQAMQKKQ